MPAFIIYIMGVSGSGKTTIGEKLAGSLAIPFFDADDFHSIANKEKMNAGHPLTDDDRISWLNTINQLAKEQANKKGAIIACSALKEKYRELLSAGIPVPVRWIFLQGSFQLINERLLQRKDHFMSPALLQSQYDILEIPTGAIIIDIANSPEQIVSMILKQLNMQA